MDTNLPGSGEPEYLGVGPVGPDAPDSPTGPDAHQRGPRGRRRTAVLAASGVAVAAVLGVGGWGLAQFLSGGTEPAGALPADTAAFISLDLDPSASQKIEAIRTLKKFPGLADQMHLGARDDLRRWFFEKVAGSGSCTSVDYDKDIAPWIGDRMAVAAVPDGDAVLPVLALQAGDESAARAAVTKLDACDHGGDSAVVFRNGYLLVTDSQKHADALGADVDKGVLADDGDYQTWMDRAGDSGVVTGYAAADAPQLLRTLAAGGMPLTMPGSPVPGMTGPGSPTQSLDRMLKRYKNFQGAAMVFRFHDGAFETEVVTKGLPSSVGADTPAPSVSGLPATTALAISAGLHEGWLKDYLDTMSSALGGRQQLDSMMRQGEQATGLTLPDDIETLLGKGVTISVDGSIDLKGLASGPDPTKVPVALRITGDPAKVTAVIDKLKAAAGPDGRMLQVRQGDGTVVVGLSPSYVDQVNSTGGLGSVTSFSDVVPDAAKATSLFYLNFDAGDWAAHLGDLVSDGDPTVRANIAPLDALGISGWVDGDGVQHGLLRLTTD